MALSLLRRMHRWLGLLLALPLLIQGLTGAILALAPVLPDLAARRRQPRASQPAPARSSPRHRRICRPACAPARYLPAAAPGETAHGAFRRRIRRRVAAASTCASIRSRSPCSTRRRADGVIDWIKALHTNLLIEGRSGRSIIGWIGVGLLALAMIGVVLWWPQPGRVARGVHDRSAGARSCVPSAAAWRGRHLEPRAAAGDGVPPAWCWRFRRRRAVRSVWRMPTRSGPVPTGRRAGRRRRTGRSRLARGATHRDCASARCCCRPAGADPVRVLLVPPGAEGVAATVAVAVDADGRGSLSVQDPRAMPARRTGAALGA